MAQSKVPTVFTNSFSSFHLLMHLLLPFKAQVKIVPSCCLLITLGFFFCLCVFYHSRFLWSHLAQGLLNSGSQPSFCVEITWEVYWKQCLGATKYLQWICLWSGIGSDMFSKSAWGDPNTEPELRTIILCYDILSFPHKSKAVQFP